jgi:hypothetical protein
MQLSDLWTAVCLGAGIASVVVCLIAIWLAVQFYGKATEADKGLSNALIQLKVETALLQKLSGRQLAGLLGYGTASRSSQEKLLCVLERVGTPAASMVIPAHVLNGDQTGEELVAQSVSSCVAAHHFLALCNVLAQLLLATGEDELRPAASRVLDVSYRNFRCFDDILSRVDDARIKTNPYHGTYQVTCEMFKPRVASASTLSSAEKFFTDFP